MKTLLALSKEPGFASSVRVVLDPERYRVVTHAEVWEAAPLLRQGTVDACILDADLTDIRPIRTIEQVREAMPQCPVLVYATAMQREWEEEAYLLGVEHILVKPIRARLLNTVLDRIWKQQGSATEIFAAPPAVEATPPAPGRSPVQTLETLRNLSEVLGHSLSSEALLKQFLQVLREIVGVNRVVVFLRQPGATADGQSEHHSERRLRPACVLGLPAGAVAHFELSLETGIGGYLYRKGRILMSASEAARAERQIQKEFDLLGAQVAVPILDRESLVGVAVLDGRLTGEPLTHEELTLVFHLLEDLGLAIQNSWRHDRLASSHEMMSDILDESGSGCLVIGRDLIVLHANDAARVFFGRPGRRGEAFEFGDLPQSIGSKVFEALRSGTSVPPFKHQPQSTPDTIYRVSVSPFKTQNSVTANAVLLMIEDFTQTERSQRLEIEASNLRLVKSMAEQLAHEIGNSLVPLSTHQQLLAKKFEDPEFRASLGSAMSDTVQRISRFSNQMLFLARDTMGRADSVPVAKLIQEAFQEAQKYYAPKAANLTYDSGGQSVSITCDHAGLKQALSEILLNALQSNPPNAPVQVRSGTDTDAEGSRWVHIEVRDSGPGFSTEAVRRASEPFFSTRNVGLGLGLTVTRKIIERHQGKLEIRPSNGVQAGIVRVSLPMKPNEPADA